jgi:hypothetical protein
VKIAVSGHRGLDDEVSALISKALSDHLAQYDGHELVGLTSLADGADQLFAAAVLDRGGLLHVVVPSVDYREALPPDSRATFDALLARAARVEPLPHTQLEAHMDASRRIVDDADELVAVWDGQPARAWGGTADVVAYARQRNVPVTVIWPPGAHH